MSHNQHLTCRLKPVLLSLLLIVHLKGFGEALQVQTKDNVVHHLPNDRAVMHSTLLGDLVHVLGDYSDSCISPLVDIDPDAFTDLVRYMKEVHNEVEDASEWIRNELGARSPSQTTRVLEAANYLEKPPCR
ncbi:unnamed protein product (mitochondrion) [Plasmodiophora brassicae]|uniref:SKP1 component POZ domain-containing protein n=1 Tax=Plasmodiophora brassicae TaxID=37360 RepID=A0A3P3XYM2_PLABS|nr:unnamed protein product [Plasmodiophora brassicae]